MFGADRQGEKISGFAVVLVHHRMWGAILMPYTFEKDAGRRFATIREPLSPYPSTEVLGMLTPDEREVVKLINDYSEKNLYRLFSRETSVRKFTETVPKEKIETLIRPYIEARMYKALKIIRDEGIPLFHQRIKTTNFHADDILLIPEVRAEGVFRFHRTADGTKYSLAVFLENRELNLHDTGTEIIVNMPCVIRHGNRIVFVKDLDSAKIRPFLTRQYVTIPPAAEEKYYGTFVLNAVNSYRFEATGFDVVVTEPSKKAKLTVEQTIRGNPAVILSFGYSGTTVYDNDNRNSFTRFRTTEGRFILKRSFRDREWEKECRKQLEDHGFFSDDNIHFTVFRAEGHQGDELISLIEAVNRSHRELIEAGFEIRLGSLGRKYHLGPVDIETAYSVNNDWFDLKVEVQIGEYTIPFVKFRRNIMEGIREYTLPDGTVAVLPEAWFSKYRDVFGFGKEEDEMLKIHKQHFPVVNSAIGNTENDAGGQLGRLIMPENLPATVLPAGLAAEMRGYQREGFNWMLFLQANKLGGCLADDMGLGKTLQALAVLLNDREKQGESPGEEAKKTSLIIVPASLVHNWESEISSYTPSLKVYPYKGISRRKSTGYFSYYDIILSSYHTVRQDIDILSEFRFHYIILDESQVIKNPGSAVYKAVSRLRGEHRVVLTGTPVENSLTDLWTQMNFVNPGLLGSLTYFRNEFAKPIEKSGDLGQEEKLKSIIKPFILRRTKEMVAKELPPVWEQMVYCDMTDDQSLIYEREKSAIRNSILGAVEPSGDENQAIIVLQGLMKLRQIANHPVMAIDEYGEGSGKFDIVLHDIRSVTSEGHKILIFSSFVKHLNLYAEALDREGIGFSMLTGSTVNREEVVNRFQNDETRKVFLISLKAGGVGLNLTAADYVFILDPWWNPAAEMQALNRAHRIGQEKNVFVFRYITAETIEEKIISLQQRKSKIAETFISSNNPLKDMDIAQILEIIG